jgi:hypothetical protein
MHRVVSWFSTLVVLLLLTFVATVYSAAKSIPPGTILPIQLDSTLSSAKAVSGHVISARLMQDVPLGDGSRIPARAKITGQIINAKPASSTSPTTITFRFDTIHTRGVQISIKTSLRALASFVDVEQAQIPIEGPDRGTSANAWTTVQIGGETVYRGGGPVESFAGPVGKPVYGGVLADVRSNPERGCQGVTPTNNVPQALWVFSSDACGVYDLRGLNIRHAGRTTPVGDIILDSPKSQVKIGGGAGMLLQVQPATDEGSGQLRD